MAHELTIRSDNTAEMAYAGATPWHGLGQSLQSGAPIEEWIHAAGLNWEIKRSPVNYENDGMNVWTDNQVLFRSDTNAPLSIVSKKYHVVQPGNVLEFFRDLVSHAGFEIETAGTLKGGKRIWALARTGFDGNVVPGDMVRSYLLLVTSCDGGLATTAQYTSVRVVCNNTLQMSLGESANASKVKVRHNTMFDPVAVKESLGLNAGVIYGEFMNRMQSYANVSITENIAEQMIETLFARRKVQGVIRESKGFKTIMQLFNGAGKGAKLDGVAGTGWGVINSVTEYFDHHVRAQSSDNRLDSAWFGQGASAKSQIVALVDEY